MTPASHAVPVTRTAIGLVAALALSGCGAASGPTATPLVSAALATADLSSAPPASLPATTPAATLAPVTTPSGPTPYPSRTTFASPLYGYEVTLPAGWTVIPATAAWDGKSPVGHDDPIVDQLLPPKQTDRCAGIYLCAPNGWAFAVRSHLTLAEWVAQGNATDHADHPCAVEPETSEPIRIDGVAGVLETKHCEPVTGILVMWVRVVSHGVAYAFCLQDQSNQRAVEPRDRADFLAMLAAIDLPG